VLWNNKFLFTAEHSPYLEAFQDNKTEVLLCYAQIDEFVMKNLGTYRSKEIVGVERSTTIKHKNVSEETLTEDQCSRLGRWLRQTFPLQIEKAEVTYRLKTHPVVLVDHQSQAIRHYLQALGEKSDAPPQRMQFNPAHNIIKGLYHCIEKDENKAKLVAKQLIHNAFIAAGIMDDARNFLTDMNNIMELALGYNVEFGATKKAEIISEKENKETKESNEKQQPIEQTNVNQEKESSTEIKEKH